MQLIELLWPAFVLLLCLVYIHAIFGLEIIKRGVIFTDLAIGQMAAVGVAISIGFMDGEYQLILTLSFALLGAALITYATHKIEHIEAFIGMLYTLGASSIMLLLASSSQGTELFQKLSATDILFTLPDELYPVVLLYLGISLIMFKVYIHLDGLMKELTFFSMLAVTVTSSVQLAGVFVVFVLLVSPAFIALIQRRFTPLYFAWAVGFVVSALALIASYYFDLPTGYSIVFFHSFTVVVFSLLAKRQTK